MLEMTGQWSELDKANVYIVVLLKKEASNLIKANFWWFICVVTAVAHKAQLHNKSWALWATAATTQMNHRKLAFIKLDVFSPTNSVLCMLISIHFLEFQMRLIWISGYSASRTFALLLISGSHQSFDFS